MKKILLLITVACSLSLANVSLLEIATGYKGELTKNKNLLLDNPSFPTKIRFEYTPTNNFKWSINGSYKFQSLTYNDLGLRTKFNFKTDELAKGFSLYSNHEFVIAAQKGDKDYKSGDFINYFGFEYKNNNYTVDGRFRIDTLLFNLKSISASISAKTKLNNGFFNISSLIKNSFNKNSQYNLTSQVEIDSSFTSGKIKVYPVFKFTHKYEKLNNGSVNEQYIVNTTPIRFDFSLPNFKYTASIKGDYNNTIGKSTKIDVVFTPIKLDIKASKNTTITSKQEITYTRTEKPSKTVDTKLKSYSELLASYNINLDKFTISPKVKLSLTIDNIQTKKQKTTTEFEPLVKFTYKPLSNLTITSEFSVNYKHDFTDKTSNINKIKPGVAASISYRF